MLTVRLTFSSPLMLPDGKESNWVPTCAGGGFEVLFRLYGPEKPFFEKTWELPDIERVTTISSVAPRLPSSAGDVMAVTVDNFIRAEFGPVLRQRIVKDGGFGKFLHRRQPASIDNQTVIRLNRDTFVFGRGVRSRCRTGYGHAP